MTWSRAKALADAWRQRSRSPAASASAQRARLLRLREMHPVTSGSQLLNDEPPAGRRVQRNLELLASEPAEKPAHAPSHSVAVVLIQSPCDRQLEVSSSSMV